MECGITVQRRGKDAHYSVCWSALRSADRWEIAKSVPAVGGIFELYWMDEQKKLRLFTVGSARFGGLRSEIRRLSDPELVESADLAAILSDKEVYFRYAPLNSAADMADVLWFFRKTYFPENPGVSHSGRYERMYMNETAPDKVRWVE
ncbi:hypothetical protein MASR2M78_10340 [Treponema sp.]